MLEQQRDTTMHVSTKLHVPRVVKIKSIGVMVLEESDAARIEEHQKKIEHCPLPILDRITFLERLYRGSLVH